jgi:replicative DNA helicase
MEELTSERNLLGAILLRNDLLFPMASIVEPSDFSLSSHRSAFAAMLEKGGQLDPFTLHDALIKSGDRSLSAVQISEWMSGPVAANAKSYAQHVKESALRRRGIALCERAAEQLRDNGSSVQESLRTAHDGILEVMAGTVEHPTIPAIQVANETLVQISDRRKRGETITGLRMGLDVLDEFTGGLNPGEFAILAARPSIGKTSLAVQATRANAEAWHPVFVFSAEMTRTQFFARMLSQVSGISSFKIRRSYMLTDQQESQLASAAAEIGSWPWYVADRSNPHISEVISRAVTEVKRHKCELIVIDHLQKIRGDGGSDTERMTGISAALTQLAKDYAPVLALSQLARPEDHNKAKWPTMLDLRGSGMLEADAHIVVMLHREIDDQKQYTSTGFAIVEKQREGMTGALPTHFDTDLLRFIGR